MKTVQFRSVNRESSIPLLPLQQLILLGLYQRVKNPYRVDYFNRYGLTEICQDNLSAGQDDMSRILTPEHKHIEHLEAEITKLRNELEETRALIQRDYL